jgi:HPt (histidine-containing phosphotransfer) domain-containing protein
MNERAVPTLDVGVLDALREAVGGDRGFVADLVQTYLADATEQLTQIDTAVAARDARALVRPAHTLKSASLTVGAVRLGELARTLEQRARTERLDGVDADASAAREEWHAAQKALRAWLTSSRRPA